MENFSNNPTTTLSAAITSTGATSITVTSAVSFPAVNFRILIDSEYMLVTNVSGTTLTVTRGIESSTAATHSSGATVTHIVTAAGLIQAINDRAQHVNFHYGDWTTVADGSTITFDFSLTDKHTVASLGGNRTLVFSNMQNGQIGLIELTQDGTGSRTVTWPSSSGSVTLTTTASKRDLITVVKRVDGSYVISLSISNY